MTAQEIYILSEELTEQQINNVLGAWNQNEETKSINTYNTLVRLGDSKALAMATVISERCNSNNSYNEYYKAYCN